MDDSVMEGLLQQLIDQNSQILDRLTELIVGVQEIAREMDRGDPRSFLAQRSALLSAILAARKNHASPDKT